MTSKSHSLGPISVLRGADLRNAVGLTSKGRSEGCTQGCGSSVMELLLLLESNSGDVYVLLSMIIGPPSKCSICYAFILAVIYLVSLSELERLKFVDAIYANYFLIF